MSPGLVQKILDREISASLSARKAYRDFYGSAQLVKELDIVAELKGHTGCVNALCWSKSGQLLASGSDDQHINIHTYQSGNTDQAFRLATTVATGHTANIFSVKFMPHSNDNTIISCAGDDDVRVFDLNYTGSNTDASVAAARATAGRTARQTNMYDGVRYLSDGNTNSRVYRSHADRAKRIVVEDSPHLFLTCGEDGDVRQWDLRQPSAYYPRPRHNGDSEVPPPLISYKQYNLDLNTISCSPSQPHYIALGGAHIFCFLHDRRMTGRDRLRESGQPARSPRTETDIDAMDQATRCVRKFAPGGYQRTTSSSRGHITACKISDARPDELIVSWSNDSIYSFDLIRGREDDSGQQSTLKRKRRVNDTKKATSKSTPSTTLRVSYGNGQQEVIRVQDEPLSEAERDAHRLLVDLNKIQTVLFEQNATSLERRFLPVLELCSRLMPIVDEAMREWTYPMDPTPDQVTRQRLMRSTREAVRRNIQAAGTLARVLCGQAQLHDDDLDIESFLIVDNRASDLEMATGDAFILDFVKAICVWLDSGTGNLIEVFTRPTRISASSKTGRRLPIPQAEANVDSLNTVLASYLAQIATTTPILDPEESAFLNDEERTLWERPADAVAKFCDDASHPFADLTGGDGLQRSDAVDYWGLRVARGLLLQAFEALDPDLIELAFSGRSTLRRAPANDYTHMGGRYATDAAENAPPSGTGSAPSDTGLSETANNDITTDDDDNDNDEEDTEYYEGEDDSSEPDEVDGVPFEEQRRLMYQSRSGQARQERLDNVHGDLPWTLPMVAFSGAANSQTVKDCNYFGLEDEYVVAGSDDGNVFIWDRKTGSLVNILQGDSDVVNVVQGHPYEPTLAVSGIDHTVKIFSPDARAQRAARFGGGTFTESIPATSWPHRSRPRRSSAPTRRPQTEEDDEDAVEGNGLASRRRWHDRDRIIENNSRATRRGNDDVLVTRSMLMQLAQHVRARRVAEGGDPDEPLIDGLETITDEDGQVRVVVSEDCTLM